MKEKNILKKLKDQIGKEIDFYSIETGSTELGIPDVYFSGDGFEGWIELKQAKLKKYASIVKIPYRPSQQKFLRKQLKKGLSSFVLISIENRFYLLNNFDKYYKNKYFILCYCLWSGENFDNNLFVSMLKGMYK